MDMMPSPPSEHVYPSSHGNSGGNKKPNKSIDKEKEIVEKGMKDAIEKVEDAIKISWQLIAEKIRTSSEIIAYIAPISPLETYKILLDLGF